MFEDYIFTDDEDYNEEYGSTDNEDGFTDNEDGFTDNDEDGFMDDEDYIAVFPSVKAYERVGGIREFLGTLVNADLNILSNTIENLMLPPLEKFNLYVFSICQKIISNNITTHITHDYINYLLSKAKEIKDVRYLNPTAYILGSLCLNDQHKIDKDKYNNIVTKVLPKTEASNSVFQEDVLRYARFWELHILKNN